MGRNKNIQLCFHCRTKESFCFRKVMYKGAQVIACSRHYQQIRTFGVIKEDKPTGISICPDTKKFYAQVYIGNRKSKYVGRFDDQKQAIEARKEWIEKFGHKY